MSIDALILRAVYVTAWRTHRAHHCAAAAAPAGNDA